LTQILLFFVFFLLHLYSCSPNTKKATSIWLGQLISWTFMIPTTLLHPDLNLVLNINDKWNIFKFQISIKKVKWMLTNFLKKEY
jgi:uncharacterized metal-binding protein